MVKILGFDTCLDKMFVALGTDGKVLSTKIVKNSDTHYHSAFLISTIKKLLLEANLTPKDIDIVAVNSGPGSFTGIRACNTVARVFAQANNIKTVSVSSLEILARLSNCEKSLIALDARKNSAYCAIFEKRKMVLKPQAILLDEVKNIISNNSYDIITDDKLQEIIGGTSYQQINADLGEILLNIAFEKVNNNEHDNWRNLKPLYIQPPPVNGK